MKRKAKAEAEAPSPKDHSLPPGMMREPDGRLIFRKRWPVEVGAKHPGLAKGFFKRSLGGRDVKVVMPRYGAALAEFDREVTRLLAPTAEEQQNEWLASLNDTQRAKLKALLTAEIGPRIEAEYPPGTVFLDGVAEDWEGRLDAPQVILPSHPSGNPFLAQEPTYKAVEEAPEQAIARAAAALVSARRQIQGTPAVGPRRTRKWGADLEAGLAEQASRLERMLEDLKSQKLPDGASANSGGPTLEIGFQEYTSGLKDDRYKRQMAWSLRLFHGIVGEKPLVDLRTVDLATFQAGLRKMPISTTTRNAILAGRMTVREAIDAWTPETEVLSPTAIGKHMDFIRSMSAVAFGQGHAGDGKADPFATFRKIRTKKAETRRYFKLDELERLFAEMQSRWLSASPERIWISLLALFHGARREEICQLLKTDVREIEGVWCIAITSTDEPDDTGDKEAEGNIAKRLKTENAKRILPIHHRVLEAGFLEHVRRSPGPRVFASLTKDSDGRWGGNFGKRFAELKAEAGVKGRRALTFHSFRHTAIGAMRNLGFPHSAQLALAGHAFSAATAGVNDDYGPELNPNVTKPWVDKIAYNVKALDGILAALKSPAVLALRPLDADRLR